MSLCLNIIFFLLVILLVVLFGFSKWRYQYWERKKLPYLKPEIPLVNLGSVIGQKKHLSLELKHLYDTMKRNGWRHGGIYRLFFPIYVPVDLDLIKNIMTKDFQYFTDRGFYHNEKIDPLSAHLFNIGGAKWRNLRTKLTPSFSSGKMKMMFHILPDCEAFLQKRIRLEYAKKAPIDIKAVLEGFTIDVIASCAFGLDCKTVEDEGSPFRAYGQKVFDKSILEYIKIIFANNYPKLARLLNVRLYSEELNNFFVKIVRDTVEHRWKNNVVRKDFLQLLIDLKNEKLEKQEEAYASLTVEEIAAQCFVFLFAGFETSAATMSFAMYELAKNQNLQDETREEINSVLKKYDGRISYEALQEMIFLDQVINESMRKYPPGSLLPRKCVKDYKIPDTDIIIEKDTFVYIPVLAIHHDEKYYPDPDKFNPERFSKENRESRHNFAYMPFGKGPRICIGIKLGLMQSKVGLASLLSQYKFTVNQKTQEPLKIKPYSFVIAAEGEIWLDAHELN